MKCSTASSHSFITAHNSPAWWKKVMTSRYDGLVYVVSSLQARVPESVLCARHW